MNKATMKNKLQQGVLVSSIILGVLALQGCSPKVGSPDWCAEMKEKPKGDWSANEATNYAKHCIF